MCSDGITLSLFDMIGGGVNLAENYQKLLAESKPFLNKVKALGLEFANLEGITVLVCPESAYTLHTAPSARHGHPLPAGNILGQSVELLWHCLQV